MNNYLLTIQYDGTNYNGWQNQSNSTNTIQAIIEKSISTILKQKIKIIGSGRTDKGVHALEQKANFKTSDFLDIKKFQYSLNSILPADISIKNVLLADEKFHARFDAKRRTYIYIITQTKSPFYFKYSYFYPFNVDIKYLNEISNVLLGEKDFSSFCKKSSKLENKYCNIFFSRWIKRNDLLIFRITANRFLRGMVRAIVGTLLKLEKNKILKSEFEIIINSNNRELAGNNVPAKGLFLYKVEY